MEGAIKLLKFCLEQKEAGNDLSFGYAAHINSIYVSGHKGLWSPGKHAVVNSFDNWTDPKELTPERADQIINEIKEKLK